MTIDTGYEGPDEEEPRINQWSIRNASFPGPQGRIPVQVLCNKESIGIIYVEKEEDVEWLRKRLTSTQTPDY